MKDWRSGSPAEISRMMARLKVLPNKPIQIGLRVQYFLDARLACARFFDQNAALAQRKLMGQKCVHDI